MKVLVRPLGFRSAPVQEHSRPRHVRGPTSAPAIVPISRRCETTSPYFLLFSFQNTMFSSIVYLFYSFLFTFSRCKIIVHLSKLRVHALHHCAVPHNQSLVPSIWDFSASFTCFHFTNARNIHTSGGDSCYCNRLESQWPGITSIPSHFMLKNVTCSPFL